MNPFQDHALADARHAEHYRRTGRGGRARITGPSARERVGLLLVEAGLQLMVRGERSGPARDR
jgi:hypothetical protein